MYKNRKIIVIAPAFNEAAKIGVLAGRMPYDIVDKFLVVDDGSTDETQKNAEANGAVVLKHRERHGVGIAIRHGFITAIEENFDIVVVIAGNNKDNPKEIPRLLDPICDSGHHFVMGSRYLPGGIYGGDMPFYRILATKFVHPFIVRFFTKRKITESSNGFRAFDISVLKDERINLDQDWLKDYQLEMYLLMRILMLDFKTTEVPISKIYPSSKIGNTKMTPIIGWWKMLYPLFLVGLGIRK